jgi:hypothetical protein
VGEARILPNDRCAYVGSTRSGKSTLGFYHFAHFRTQRVMIDPKGEWQLPGFVTVRAPHVLRASLERLPAIRYVPSVDDQDEWDAVYAALFEHGRATRRGLVILTDEVDSVGTANRYPRGLRLIQKQGAALGIGHQYFMQRPVEVPRPLITEATHIFVVAPPLLTDDLDTIARQLRISAAELAERLSAYPPHGFLWFDRRNDELIDCPPLTPEMIRASGASARKYTP